MKLAVVIFNAWDLRLMITQHSWVPRMLGTAKPLFLLKEIPYDAIGMTHLEKYLSLKHKDPPKQAWHDDHTCNHSTRKMKQETPRTGW